MVVGDESSAARVFQRKIGIVDDIRLGHHAVSAATPMDNSVFMVVVQNSITVREYGGSSRSKFGPMRDSLLSGFAFLSS